MEELDEDEGRTEVPANRARPIDFVIVVLGAIEDIFGGFRFLLMSHANWTNNRQRFMREASEDIERIVSGE